MTVKPGQKFGRLTVMGLADHRGKRGQKYWVCACECGETREIEDQQLKKPSGAACRNCKPLGRPAADLLGKVFGKLTVMRRAGSKVYKRVTIAMWACRCECGTEVLVQSGHLKASTRACRSCAQKKNATVQNN